MSCVPVPMSLQLDTSDIHITVKEGEKPMNNENETRMETCGIRTPGKQLMCTTVNVHITNWITLEVCPGLFCFCFVVFLFVCLFVFYSNSHSVSRIKHVYEE